MEVKVPSLTLYDQLYTDFDFVEASQRNGDGSISTDVLANAPSARRCAPRRPVRRHPRGRRRRPRRTWRSAKRRSSADARAQKAGPDAARARRPRAPRRRAAPGEVVIMRAYTFTNYAGRFLYVEAHTKAATR